MLLSVIVVQTVEYSVLSDAYFCKQCCFQYLFALNIGSYPMQNINNVKRAQRSEQLSMCSLQI